MSSIFILFAAFSSRQLRSFTCHGYSHKNFFSPAIFANPKPKSSYLVSSSQLIIQHPKGSRQFKLYSTWDTDKQEENPPRTSVTGTIYTHSGDEVNGDPIVVQLFTKEGCTLCDKVKDVLRSVESTHPHTLEAVDITDPDKTAYFEKYKYDIPVLHIHGQYWTKHRLTKEEAILGLEEIRMGEDGVWGFQEPKTGEPDAGALERRQMKRMQKEID